MNTANWIPDLFMKRLMAQEDWTFPMSSNLHDHGKAFEEKYCEYEKKAEAGEIFGQKQPAMEIWKKMLAMHDTGHPWITLRTPATFAVHKTT